MGVQVISLGGFFIALNSTQIVDALPAPQERRAYRLHGVNWGFSDSAAVVARAQMALHLGDFEPGTTVETGGIRTVNLGDPLQSGVLTRQFGVAHFGSDTANASFGGNHQVHLYGMVVADEVKALVNLPDSTDDTPWNAELYFEIVRVSTSEWTKLRHRPPVETRNLGVVTV